MGDSRLEARSDYGSVTTYLDGRDPAEAARTVLAGLVPSAERS
jgi:hypothetical protein